MKQKIFNTGDHWTGLIALAIIVLINGAGKYSVDRNIAAA